MLVADVVIQTQPGCAARVAAQIALIKTLPPPRAEGSETLHLTWPVPEDDTADGLSEALQALHPDILSVRSSFIGRA